MKLLEIVNEYKLRYGGFEFWCPYWINEPGTPEGLFAGKGRPDQIQAKLNELAEQYQDELKNAEEVRYLMLRNGLGVDCSSFVYYVLDAYLQEQHQTTLVEHLFVSKNDILEALEKPSWQKTKKNEVEAWPSNVSLALVADKFGKDPIYITNVARLCDKLASLKVGQADLRAGDMLYLKNGYGDHILLVVSVTTGQVMLADSRFDPCGPGGINVFNVSKKLELPAKYRLERICRLKVLDVPR